MFINKTVDSLTWQLIKRSCTDQSIFDFLVQVSSAFTIFLTLALVRMQAIKALEPSTTLLQTSAILNLYHFSRKKVRSIQFVGWNLSHQAGCTGRWRLTFTLGDLKSFLLRETHRIKWPLEVPVSPFCRSRIVSRSTFRRWFLSF